MVNEGDALAFVFRTIDKHQRSALTEQQLTEAARDDGSDPDLLWKTVASLERQGLVRCTYTNVFGDTEEPPSSIHPTFRGTQSYLKTVLPDYDATRKAAARAIALGGDRSAAAVAHSLGTSSLVAEHFIDAFRREKLVDVGGIGPLGLHISGIASRSRWAAELSDPDTAPSRPVEKGTTPTTV